MDHFAKHTLDSVVNTYFDYNGYRILILKIKGDVLTVCNQYGLQNFNVTLDHATETVQIKGIQ